MNRLIGLAYLFVAVSSERGFKKLERSEKISIAFGVNDRNLDKLESIFYEVSSPSHSNYGKYKTREEILKLTSNEMDALFIHDYLFNLTSRYSDYEHTIRVHPSFNIISLTTHADVINSHFQSDFYEYKHDLTKDTIHRTKNFVIPVEIQDKIAFHALTTSFPRVYQGINGIISSDELNNQYMNKRNLREGTKSRNSLRKDGQVQKEVSTISKLGADISMTPQIVNNYYGVQQSSSIHPSSSISSLECCMQYFSPSDLSKFEEFYDLPHTAVNVIKGTSYGFDEICVKNITKCEEGNLDLQWMVSVAQNIPVSYWNDLNCTTQDVFLDWILDLNNQLNPPLVHSVSYGDLENQVDVNIMKKTNAEFMKAGVRGISIFVSSGDDGVGNFEIKTDKNNCGYNPQWPATSPYVTSVGATQFINGDNDFGEQACAQDNNPPGAITSGGGFSLRFPRPTYQEAMVDAFLNSNGVPANVPRQASAYPSPGFNSQGRAYPDISALGHNFPLVIGNQFYMLDGTSVSTPLIASMFVLINNERLLRNMPPLGFVNPLLYQIAESDPNAFNDITTGRNYCSSGLISPAICCPSGFTATQGFDAVTGLGTPKFASILAHALNKTTSTKS